jgi:hypothetical protein
MTRLNVNTGPIPNTTNHIYAVGLRKVSRSKFLGGDYIPTTVKGAFQICYKCKQPIVPMKDVYFVGEILSCDNCGESFTIIDRFGFMRIALTTDIAQAYTVLRFLERLVRYRIGFNGSQVLYFDKEPTAERYSDLLLKMGDTRSWYGDRVKGDEL